MKQTLNALSLEVKGRTAHCCHRTTVRITVPQDSQHNTRYRNQDKLIIPVSCGKTRFIADKLKQMLAIYIFVSFNIEKLTVLHNIHIRQTLLVSLVS